MAFNTNQTRHFFVVDSYSATALTSASTLGAANLIATQDNGLTMNYAGPGGIVRTDVINLDNVVKSSVVESTKMRDKYKVFKIKLDSTINGGAPVAGEDYVLLMNFYNYFTINSETAYQKYAEVHATTGMTAEKFTQLMAISIYQNFSKEIDKPFKISLGDDTGAKTEVNASYDKSTANTYTVIYLEEQPSHWILGRMEQKTLNVTVQSLPITTNGDQLPGLTIEAGTPNTASNNGKNVADMEYFYIMERGDSYKNMGYPHVIDTTYVANSGKNYNLVDITYFYAGNGEDVQKSQSTLTLAILADGLTPNTLTETILTALDTASGGVIKLTL